MSRLAPAHVAAFALISALGALAAACDPDVVVGSDAEGGSVVAAPPAPWSATHETGDFSEWTGDGFGWKYVTSGSSLLIAAAGAHGGSGGLVSTIASTGSEEQAVVGREARLTDGYYSAWFRLPSATSFTGRVVFKLSATAPYVDLFDIMVLPDDSGVPHVALYDHLSDSFLVAVSETPVVPLDTWFELEAFYRATAATDGRLVVWQDGASVLDLGARATAPDDQVTFIVGSVSQASGTEPAVTQVDDVALRAGLAP